MGHQHSSNSCSRHSSLTDWRDFVFTQGHLLKQVAALKYGDFVQAVEYLNTISNTLSNSKGKYLVFSIVPGTDGTSLLWKSRVRITCCKMTNEDGNIICESARTMTLKNFMQVYDSILQQCQSIEHGLLGGREADLRPPTCREADGGEQTSSVTPFEAADDKTSSKEQVNTDGLQDQQQWLEISTIFATVEQVSVESSSSDDDSCCICMENKSDIVLSCTHTYCHVCIDDWRKKHPTCPMCMGDIGSSKDVWALPDKPNADDMTAYLMSIADNKEPIGKGKRCPPRRPHIEEWEKLSL